MKSQVGNATKIKKISLNYFGKLWKLIVFAAKNPPPICVPVPNVPLLMVCFRFYGIELTNSSIRVCFNTEFQVAKLTILVLQFDCVRATLNSIAIEKPPPKAIQYSSSRPSWFTTKEHSVFGNYTKLSEQDELFENDTEEPIDIILKT